MYNIGYSTQILTEPEFSNQIFKKNPQILKFHKNQSCGSWMDRQTNIMMLIVAFQNFVNVPKNGAFHTICILLPMYSK